jgi:hypothetical protein
LNAGDDQHHSDFRFEVWRAVGNPNLSTASITPQLALFLQACLDTVIFRLMIELVAAVLIGRP